MGTSLVAAQTETRGHLGCSGKIVISVTKAWLCAGFQPLQRFVSEVSPGSTRTFCVFARDITKVREAILCDGRHTRGPLCRLPERHAGQSVTSRDDHERIFALRLADDLSYRPRKNDRP